jgi:hypothetical protein
VRFAKIATAFVLLLICAFALLAQQADTPVPQLRQGALSEVKQLYSLPIMSELKSAGDCGKLFQYFNQFSKLHYFSCDGAVTHEYDLTKVDPKYKDDYSVLSDFTSDGSTVYTLYGHNPKPHVELADCYVAKFGITGDYKGAVKLQGPDFIACTQLVSVDRDTLLLGAISTTRTPFLGLFSTSGQFLKELHLPGDMTFTDDPKQKLDDSLVFNDEDKFALYAQVSKLDNDGEGNVVLFRHSPADTNEEQIKEPNVFFIVQKDGTMKHFALPKPSAKTALLIDTPRAFHGHIVTLWAETNDASQPMKAMIRVFDFDGHEVHAYQFNPVQFGSKLVEWNERKSLFLTQAGDITLKVRPMGILEALPQ